MTQLHGEPHPTARRPRPSALRRVVRAAGSILGTFVAVIVVMVACVVIVLAVATRLSSKQQYTAFGHPVLVVLSGSMTPTIDTGDLIIDNPVGRVGSTKLHVGQIVTFLEAPGSQSSITHRIVKVIHRRGQVLYVTKGDANNAPDSAPRPSSLAVGIYDWKIPRGGYFLTNLHKPLVLALLLAAPLLWFVGKPLRRWAREEDEPAKDPSDTDGTGEGATP